MLGFPFRLPIDGTTPRRILIEENYDLDGEGPMVPAVVIPLHSAAELTAITSWLATLPGAASQVPA